MMTRGILVKDVPKVLGFIGGTTDKPAPIPDREADAILQRIQDGVDKPRPKVLFEPGEVVRVTDGPFNDFQWHSRRSELREKPDACSSTNIWPIDPS